MRVLILVFVLLLLGGWWLLDTGRVPARWTPWAVPDPAEPPGLLTAWQLNRLGQEPAACFDWLDRADVGVSVLPDREDGDGCGLEGAGRLLQAASGIRYGAGVTARCPVLAALALWERHVLQPAAVLHLGSRVARVTHLGTYACRDIRTTRSGGTGGGRRSEHATANAIDIAGVTLADGRVLTILRDWDRQRPDGKPASEARFWRAVRDGACDLFKVVLSPDYNDLHRDHLHLDMGPFKTCR